METREASDQIFDQNVPLEWLSLPKSREEARKVGSIHFFSGKPCKHGHISRFYTKSGCWECSKIVSSEHHKVNNKSRNLKLKDWYQINIEKNRARARVNARNWRKNNPVRCKELLQRPEAKAKKAFYCQTRYASKSKSTPAWLTKSQKNEMISFYKEAQKITKSTGIKYSVDHIEPLRGKTSCGLHVPWNLQIIESKENSMKHNKLENSGW